MSSIKLQRTNITLFDVEDKQTALPRWELWVDQFKHELNEIGIVDKQQQKELLFINAGTGIKKLVEKVTETSKDQEEDVEAVVKSITNYFTVEYNQDYAIYKFRQCKQQSQEIISDYVAKLEFLAKCCKFPDKNAEIKAQILDRGYSDKVREKAFHEVITLDQLIEFAKTVPVDSVKKEPSGGEERRGTKEPSGGQERWGTKEPSGGEERHGMIDLSGGQERRRTNSQGDWRASKNQHGRYASKHEQTVGRAQQHQTYKGTGASDEMYQHNSRLAGKSITPRRVKQYYDYFLVLDFEATCDNRPKVIEPQEIIEFPVLKVSATTFEVESKFHQFVKPVHHPQLTDFCLQLTTITQDEVDSGMPFPYVLKDFLSWMENDVGMESEFLFITCGDWDLKNMLPSQCNTSKVEVPRYCEEWLNLKKGFSWVTGTYPKGMMEMINELNLKHTGVHHRGLDDCKNIANIVRALADRGCKFEPSFGTRWNQHY